MLSGIARIKMSLCMIELGVKEEEFTQTHQTKPPLIFLICFDINNLRNIMPFMQAEVQRT